MSEDIEASSACSVTVSVTAADADGVPGGSARRGPGLLSRLFHKKSLQSDLRLRTTPSRRSSESRLCTEWKFTVVLFVDADWGIPHKSAASVTTKVALLPIRDSASLRSRRQ